MKRVNIGILMLVVLFVGCIDLSSQTPISVGIIHSGESDLSKHHIYFWSGTDTTIADLNFVKTIDHIESDTLWASFERVVYEGGYIMAGVRSSDNSGNSSEMAFSNFVFVPNLPPKKPDVILMIGGR